MISAFLFDFGGTLDADGHHWLDRFYRIYEQIGFSAIPKEHIKEAFYWADAQLEEDPAAAKLGYRPMMQRHVHYQFEKLGIENHEKLEEAAAAFYRPAEKVLRRNRGILERLHHAGLKLGVLSNFYGNVEMLCQEAGLKPFLAVILDSIVVGLKKPDPKIFQMAAERLGVPLTEIAFVGDSFQRDVIPAKSLGMTTIWMAGDRRQIPPDASKVDKILYSLEDILDLIPSHLPPQ